MAPSMSKRSADRIKIKDLAMLISAVAKLILSVAVFIGVLNGVPGGMLSMLLRYLSGT